MRVANLHTQLEPASVFRGRVPRPKLEAYEQAHAGPGPDGRPNGMRPDILVHNFPVESQDDLEHLNGPSARTKAAIFEINGLRVSD